MQFEILDTLSVPGDPAKPNEDAVLAEAIGAVVLDGATPVSEPLMPGKSDAAWIASFGARRLISHLKNGDAPRAALRHAFADAERSFEGLRRRAPAERFEIPCASMILAVPNQTGLDALWYGDCAALMQRPGAPCEAVGHEFEMRAQETDNAKRFLAETGIAPVEALARAPYTALFRDARSKVNSPDGTWLFAPYPPASEHVSRVRLDAPAGTLLLLASDGFLALANGYKLYDIDGLIAAATSKGLVALEKEARALEQNDPEGRSFPRFKKSDDATAVLLKLRES